MMKKFMIIITMFLLSIVIINQSVHAETIFKAEPAANTGGLWHEEDGNRVYVNMRYTNDSVVYETGSEDNATHPEYDLSLYTLWEYGGNNLLYFPLTSLYNDYQKISNPNPDVYDKFVVEIIPHMTAPAAVVPAVKVFEGVADEIEVFLHSYPNYEPACPADWSYITLDVDGEEILSSRETDQTLIDIYDLDQSLLNPYADDNYFGVRMYWEQSETAEVIDPNIDVDPWGSLPETEGSPVNPLGDWGTVTNVIVDNQSVSFDVNYLGTIYPVSEFAVSSDLDFINKSNDILYYTDPNTGDRILYFNFGETLDSAILAATMLNDVEVWAGEALWNLTQNQIKVTDVLTVYNYIPEVDADGNVYSYFYMPDVPMDDLISVSAILAYRYWSDGFLGIGELEPGEIQYKSVQAVRGETSSVNPSWVETAYTTAYIAGGLAVVGTVSGIAAPIYGWPIAAACFITAGVLTAGDINEWFAYDVQQIDHVIPSIALTNEINTYISSVNEAYQFTADTDKLYKLHLATLSDEADVEIMSELSNITQVVWETDGEIYVVNDESILNIDWSGPGTLIPSDTIGNGDLDMLVYIGIGVAGLYVFSKLELAKKPGLVILIIGGVLYILYEKGLL